MSNLIDRQATIDFLTLNAGWKDEEGRSIEDWDERKKIWTALISLIPSAQPEICCDAEPRLHITGYIPEAWIENEIEWLRGLENPFASLTAMNIKAMLKRWHEQESEEGKHDAIREGAERGVPADAQGLGATHDRDAKEAN